MKTAKEMFEELGYKQIKHLGCVIAYYKYVGNIVYFYEWEDVYVNNSYSFKLHSAIHQQLIELGWLDETSN